MNFVAPGSLRHAWLAEFLKFGLVGAIGFVVNVAVVYLLRSPAGLYAAGIVAWILAATVTWSLNRAWTFRERGEPASALTQWPKFLAANFVGFLLYYGTYSFLIGYSALFVRLPVAAVFAGMIAGMIANFTLSRTFVFRRL